MNPKIRSITPMTDFCLAIVFEDGKHVVYDMKEDIQTLPGYGRLKEVKGLFEQIQVDESRTCVSWTEDIDLPSDILYEYGEMK